MSIQKIIKILEECKLYITNTDNYTDVEIAQAYDMTIYLLKTLSCIYGLYGMEVNDNEI